MPLHLKRLKHSANFFHFNYDQKYIRINITQQLKTIPTKIPHKVRLLLSKSGIAVIEVTPIPEKKKSIYKITISKKKTKKNNHFLYHKTTLRKLYNTEYLSYKRKGFFDVLFQNEQEKITEGAISNIFIRKGKTYYTPPISCGVLAGVYREHFMQKNPKKVKEKILTIKDLKTADAVYCTNAVRGIVRVRLCTLTDSRHQSQVPKKMDFTL